MIAGALGVFVVLVAIAFSGWAVKLLPAIRQPAAIWLVLVTLCGAAWMGRYTLVPAGGQHAQPAAYLLDRWTGEVSLCAGRGACRPNAAQ